MDAAAGARGGPRGRRHGHRGLRLRRPGRLHAGHAQPGGRLPGAGRRGPAGAGESVSAQGLSMPAAGSAQHDARRSEEEQRDVSVVSADALPGGVLAAEEQAPPAAELGPRARLWPSLAAVYRAQLSRARVARIPLLFVAT
ncbi:hypothetical protein NGM37_34495, partial [Streptomyces sp. TRM76130]|nr:hypothetical protein [Streptomyces sp. TRM76130]